MTDLDTRIAAHPVAAAMDRYHDVMQDIIHGGRSENADLLAATAELEAAMDAEQERAATAAKVLAGLREVRRIVAAESALVGPLGPARIIGLDALGRRLDDLIDQLAGAVPADTPEEN